MSTFYEQGTYTATILEHGLTPSKRKLTPQLWIKIKPHTMIYPDGTTEEVPTHMQYERTIFRPITENTIDYVLDDLKQLGFEGDSFAVLETGHPDSTLVGVEASVRCEYQEYEGKTQERWSIARTGGGYEAEPMEPGDVQKLDALFGRQLKEKIGNSKPAKKELDEKKPKLDDAAVQKLDANYGQKKEPLEEAVEAVQGQDDVPF